MSNEPSTRRYLVLWRNDVDPAISPVGVLVGDDRYRFSYLPGVDSVPGFRALPAFPHLDSVYTSRTLFDFFAARIMDRRRPEYEDFLKALALPGNADALSVLGRSGGRRKGDFISVVEEPIVLPDGGTDHTFLVHGVRHVADPVARDRVLNELSPDDSLQIRPEPHNPVNPRALSIVSAGGTALGWVPDGLVDYIGRLYENGTLTLRVVRVNGPKQPDQLRMVVVARGRLAAGTAALPQLLAIAYRQGAATGASLGVG